MNIHPTNIAQAFWESSKSLLKVAPSTRIGSPFSVPCRLFAVIGRLIAIGGLAELIPFAMRFLNEQE
jgi:hypothetical protein